MGLKLEGEHRGYVDLDGPPGFDLSISDLCLALKTKLARAVHSPGNQLPISLIKSTEKDLALSVAMLRRMINCNSSTTHRLPPETLATIVSHLDDKSLITATRVCHHWRSVFLSSPRLWSHLAFDNDRRALVFLERSKSAPLSIDLPRDPKLSDAAKESLKGITSRVTALRGGYSSSLGRLLARPLPILRSLEVFESAFPPKRQPMPLLPSVRSLVTTNLAHPMFHLPSLTNFRFNLTHCNSRTPVSIGDGLLEFFRKCRMLEVVHVSCDDPSMEIEFSIDEASTKTVSLTFLRSFTHESPDDNVRTSLFSRLSLPSTCCLSFAVEITDPSHMFGPWICGFPDSRVASYFLDVKTVKTMLDPRETDSSVVTFKTDFLNANNMKLSLVKRSHPLFQDHPAIVTDQYLDFLKSSGVSRSVETLYFEGFPAPLPWGTASEPLSDPLWGFDSLRRIPPHQKYGVLALKRW